MLGPSYSSSPSTGSRRYSAPVASTTARGRHLVVVLEPDHVAVAAGLERQRAVGRGRTRAELARLGDRAAGEVVAGDARREAEIVLDPPRRAGLPAQRRALHDERVETLRGAVDRGAEARRPTADHEEVDLLVGCSSSPIPSARDSSPLLGLNSSGPPGRRTSGRRRRAAAPRSGAAGRASCREAGCAWPSPPPPGRRRSAGPTISRPTPWRCCSTSRRFMKSRAAGRPAARPRDHRPGRLGADAADGGAGPSATGCPRLARAGSDRGAGARRWVPAGRPDLFRPSNGGLSRALGIGLELQPHEEVDLLWSAAGPASLGAAVYGASEGLDTLIVESTALGPAGRFVAADREAFSASRRASRATTSPAARSPRRASSARVRPRPTALWHCEPSGNRHGVRLEDDHEVSAGAVMGPSGSELPPPGRCGWRSTRA